ncbi:MAG: CHAD domain-containing protein [Anaerolineales bacterium]
MILVWLDANETISLGVRRILNEIVDQILQEFTDPGEKRDEGVHDARKNCKRVRAVYRLIRDEIGFAIYREENIRFRDTARLLAGARDSLVLIQTFDKLVNTYSDELSIHAYLDFRQYLVDRYQTTLKNELDHPQRISAIQKSMREASKQISNLPIIREDFSAFQGGLQRTYRRGRKAMHRAYTQPSPDIFHEWRKQVKYLWHQVEVLESIQPEILTKLANELHILSDYLGEDHDLAVLRNTILTASTFSDGEFEKSLIFRKIDQERMELEGNALTLGERLLSDPPEIFVQRMNTYWMAWKSEKIS